MIHKMFDYIIIITKQITCFLLMLSKSHKSNENMNNDKRNFTSTVYSVSPFAFNLHGALLFTAHFILNALISRIIIITCF